MKIYNIATLCMLGLTSLTAISCSDDAEEVTTLNFSKNFAPLGTDTKTTQETSATIVWEASANATGYNLEVFEDDSLTFQGKPVQTLNTTDTQITITELIFDTRYSVRIRAITEGMESRTSSWSSVFFRTSAKQFLKNPTESQISDRSVTLVWDDEEGYAPTNIVVGPVTHEVTTDEQEAKTATVSGLEPETNYTALLYYNGKQCGKRDFTTIADLEGAILVHDGDDLKKILENEDLEDNSVIAMYAGTYNLNGTYDEETGELLNTGAAKINKNITIKGIYPTSRPIINGRFEINNGASLVISQAIINGTKNSTTDQMFNFKTAEVSYGPLVLQSCDIEGRTDAKGIIYLNVKSTVEEILIENSIVHGIQCSGGDFIDSRLGLPRKITVKNSTFYDVAGNRDFFRIDDKASDFPDQDGPVVSVDHCTFANVGGAATNYRIFYVRFAGNKVSFTNNIVAGTNYKRGFANNSSTDANPELKDNFYFNCQNLTSPGTGADANIIWFDTSSSEYDIESETGTKVRGKGNGTVLKDSPFKNDAPDFTLNPDSEAAKAGAGDPRWLQ